jgi:hypothetical protein
MPRGRVTLGDAGVERAARWRERAPSRASWGAYFVMFPRSRVLVLVPARQVVDAIELPAVLLAPDGSRFRRLADSAGSTFPAGTGDHVLAVRGWLRGGNARGSIRQTTGTASVSSGGELRPASPEV